MLKQYLQSTGERQTDFARRAQISQGFLSQLLAKRRTPSLDVAVRIERLTGGAVPAESWLDDDAPAPAAGVPARSEDAA